MATDIHTRPADSGDVDSPENKQVIDQITIYSHSNLMYWWPVWLMCFVLAAITYSEGNQMAVVPAGTVAVSDATVMHAEQEFPGPRSVLVAPEDEHFPLAPASSDSKSGPGTDPTEPGNREPARPSMTVSGSNSLGVVFAATLIVVALVSTLLMRGLISLIAIILMVTAVIALALFDKWDEIFAFFGGLDIRMNAAGYLFIGIPLFLVWAFVFFVQDRMSYMTFDEGQIRYVMEIGDSELVVPSEGSIVEKKRSDVFRHWILGMGTGDLMIRMRDGRQIEVPNIVGAGRKMRIINDMLRHKPIVVEQA
jgi:hypothetical protein